MSLLDYRMERRPRTKGLKTIGTRLISSHSNMFIDVRLLWSYHVCMAEVHHTVQPTPSVPPSPMAPHQFELVGYSARPCATDC
jgi:hypothetical protein